MRNFKSGVGQEKALGNYSIKQDAYALLHHVHNVCQNPSDFTDVSLFSVFLCLRSGSVKNHWEEIYYFVENLAEKFKR